MWKVMLSCVIVMVGWHFEMNRPSFPSSPLSQDVETRLVQTAQGPVRGYKDPVENLYAFYSIPYAQAPTGLDKFKGPITLQKREEIFEAVDQGIICPQTPVSLFEENKKNKTMQEDCLIANIYVPNTNKTNLPVLVVIHGGGFLIGFGDIFQPKKIVSSHNIIVVNFNYRLGAHGFLCLGTSDIPGNAGLKDQVALLRWVQENIAYFGGNPADVTISGYSAGAASVGLLTISKMALGSFSKIIQESGDVGGPYVMQVNPTQNAKDFASILGFDNVNNITALEFFYKNASLDLLQSGVLTTVYNSNISFLVTPCVERNVGQEIFLDDSPQNLLKSDKFPKLPTLIGFTNMEGIIFTPFFKLWSAEMNNNFSVSLPSYLGFSNEVERSEIAQEVKIFYFGDEPLNDTIKLKYIEYFTDSTFACPCLSTVKELLESGNNNVYLFYYSFVDEATTPPLPYTDKLGAHHIAETNAVLDGINVTHRDEGEISYKSRDWKVLMRETWSNFVINGIPASIGLPEWKPATKDSLNYMELKEIPEMGVSLKQNKCTFWKKLYDTYYQKPSPPEVPIF